MNSKSSFSFTKQLSRIQDWYCTHRELLFKIAIRVMLSITVLRLAYEFWRLLLDQKWNGAIDLKIMHQWVNLWFAGKSLHELNFLPATYTILWPFTGWLSFESARWLWAILYIVSLVWFLSLVIAETGIKKREEILFAVLFILSIYPTGITIGNGQVILFLLPAILTAVSMEGEDENDIAKDIIISVLFLFSSLKITVTAPFYLVSLITQRAFRPLIIAACGYILLTYIAISFHDTGLIMTLKVWFVDSSALAMRGGYANLHVWLGNLGLKQLIFPFSFVFISVFGIWLLIFRKIDIWIQLGVAAIVARVWTYHRLYDDMLIVVPMITIFRIVRNNQLSRNESLAADLLILISWLGLLSPGSILLLPFPLGTLFRTGQAIIWISMLIFLFYCAYKLKKTNRV